MGFGFSQIFRVCATADWLPGLEGVSKASGPGKRGGTPKEPGPKLICCLQPTAPTYSKKNPVSDCQQDFYVRYLRLFSYNFKFYLSGISASEINSCFVSTEFFYFIEDADATTVDLVSLLFADGAADLNRSNATEDLA